MTSRTAERFAPLLLLAAILLVWEIACRVLSVSEFVLPTPSSIAVALVEFAGPIMTNAWRTFWTTMIGFGLSIVVGVLVTALVGLFFGWYPARRAAGLAPIEALRRE
jgi:NitT/TauT family transport system permease protein